MTGIEEKKWKNEGKQIKISIQLILMLCFVLKREQNQQAKNHSINGSTSCPCDVCHVRDDGYSIPDFSVPGARA